MDDAPAVPFEKAPAALQTKTRHTLPVHPLLFGLYPVLALLARNFSQTPLNQTLRAFAAAAGATAVIWSAALLTSRKLRKSAIITSALVIVLFSYGHILVVTPPLARILVAPGCLALLALLLFIVFRSRQPLYDTTAVLNLAAIVLVAPSAWSVATGIINERRANRIGGAVYGAGSPPAHTARHVMPIINPSDPDIYYIILDAYGRADRLKEFYAYDNSPFLEELKKRGFYVADKSGANYNQTPLCLASALNMNYLDPAKQNLTPECLRQMVDESAVAEFLENRGYKYVCIWSGLEVSRVTSADVILNNEPDLNAFETQALNLSPIAASKQFRTKRYDSHRQRLVGVFDNLDTVARLPGPKFVFAHALAPHPPFVLGPHGESVYPEGAITLADASWLTEQITRDQYMNGYVSQLQYVNSRVLRAVDAIIADSKRRPIIIIQGDHGSRMTLDWDSQARTDLREPFANLNAYLVPAKVSSGLYKSITPVNSFRVILSRQFGVPHPLLPDKSYYSTADHETQFSDVTDLIPLATGPSEPPTARGLTGRVPSSIKMERGEQ